MMMKGLYECCVFMTELLCMLFPSCPTFALESGKSDTSLVGVWRLMFVHVDYPVFLNSEKQQLKKLLKTN